MSNDEIQEISKEIDTFNNISHKKFYTILIIFNYMKKLKLLRMFAKKTVHSQTVTLIISLIQ